MNAIDRFTLLKQVVLFTPVSILLFISVAISTSASVAPSPRTTVESVKLDWDHSGEAAVFTLSSRPAGGSTKDADYLSIKSKGRPPWTLSNHDDVWTNFAGQGLSRAVLSQNLVPESKRLLFVSASDAPNAHVYLILIGAGSGCCVGSLTVITPDKLGAPRIVFHASQHLLKTMVRIPDGSGIELIGQPSDSEARALKNAQSYDPYRAYLLKEDQTAIFDIALSKSYTIDHYCQWRGPKYDERYVAVGVTTGAAHCRAMSEAAFQRYRERRPELFPEH